jgi:hypothetical protein
MIMIMISLRKTAPKPGMGTRKANKMSEPGYLPHRRGALRRGCIFNPEGIYCQIIMQYGSD